MLEDYLLFLDTETTGIPHKWDAVYSDNKNWPSVIQLAWIIYDRDGIEVKRVSSYIYEKDIVISEGAYAVHSISEDYLRAHGSKRKEVLRKLAYDIRKYKPLIVGHFVELDIHTLSADYCRAKLINPFARSNFFCTMLYARSYFFKDIPQHSYRLANLYEYLFQVLPDGLHDAERDAEFTAQCFRSMNERGAIASHVYIEQQLRWSKKFHFDN